MNIDELEKKLNRLELEKASLRSKISSERRRCDTRRKILFGVAALALAESDSELRKRLLAELDGTVRESDRGLVGLPER